MGNIANLHSLFNSPWYINQDYANSYIHLLKGLIISGIKPEIIESKQGFVTTQSLSSYDDIAENSDEESKKEVAIISIKTPIVKYDQFCGPVGTQTLVKRMDKLASDSNILGVVLDIDSGGGQAYGTPEFHDYIRTYSKPVVSYCGGLMCSAAYYFGSAASYIVANKRAEAIGSIGAYTKIIDMDGVKEKEGAKVHTIYSSKSEEKNKFFEEVLKGDYENYIKEVLDPLVDTFISDIKHVRPDVNEKVFKGAVYKAGKALKLGLIDEIGNLNNAVQKVYELALNNNVNNQNNSDMADQEITLESISATLGMEDGLKLSSKLFGGKKGAFLTVEQLQSIESKLTEVNNDLNTEKNSRTEAENKVTSLENATKEALTEASLEAADKTEASIKLLGEKVAEYGSQPGEKSTSSQSEGDRFENEDTVVNESDSHNQIYKNV